MEKLQPEQFHQVRALFAPLADWQVYLTAVLHQHSPGRVYVDNLANPRSGFAISLDGAYLVGDPGNAAFNAALAAELEATLLAGDRVNPANPTLTFCLNTPEWEPALAAVLSDWRWPPLWSQNHYYRLARLQLDWRQIVPAGYTIVRLDEGLLRQQGSHLPPNIAESMNIGWQNEANFLAQGFGFAALHGEAIVCWCLADVVSGDRCEIGIETVPAHQRRGLATAVTAAAAEFCQQQGFAHIGWHCGADNPGSIKTALNVGFVLDRVYTVYTFHDDEARHYAELGRLYFFGNMPAEAADALDLALELDDEPPDYVYLLAARAEAKLGNGRYALELLNAAVDAGFGDVNLLMNLSELEPLHRLPEWQRLLASVRKINR